MVRFQARCGSAAERRSRRKAPEPIAALREEPEDTTPLRDQLVAIHSLRALTTPSWVCRGRHGQDDRTGAAHSEGHLEWPRLHRADRRGDLHRRPPASSSRIRKGTRFRPADHRFVRSAAHLTDAIQRLEEAHGPTIHGFCADA